MHDPIPEEAEKRIHVLFGQRGEIFPHPAVYRIKVEADYDDDGDQGQCIKERGKCGTEKAKQKRKQHF